MEAGFILGGLAILCILLINVLVLAKFSFARLSEEHLDDVEDLSEDAKNFLRTLYQKPERFINTSQFLILFFIVLLSSVGTALISPYIGYWERALGLHHEVLALVFDVIVIAIIALVILVLGEIMPKALGLSFPLRYVRWSAKVVCILGYMGAPFIWIAQQASSLLLRWVGAPYKNELDLVHTEEEIRMMVNRSHLEGQLDHVEGELIDNVFDFVERMAKEVMIPRQDVDCIYVEDSFEETMKSIAETSHTRYPLCVEDKDHVIGLVHIKDLMEQKEKAEKDMRLIRRDILTIPEVMKLSVLLQYMRTRRIYQAVVVDEYGGMVGLVCLEDIIEELVGDIKDEHENDTPAIVANTDGSFEFDGKVLVDEVKYAMHVDFDDPEEDTIGGFIFGLLERTPVVGDAVEVAGYTFTVTEMQGYRIARLNAVPIEVPEEEESEDE
ncbi:hemolysin family protein [uncultured Veillonella sp.]|uniref:hemolysin family protein n=1 Tax=uncultured Veillonella sp. TaxID=159268 RepID=UPI0025F799CB|nr:hemolysin family protein [uncultured Veillonella sp.]MDY3974807.1 hemolysin family protein [Veillonella caviae]